MSDISRVNKFIRELVGTDSLAEASAVRNHDVTIVIGNVEIFRQRVLALTAVALLVRCISGRVLVMFESDNVQNKCLLKSMIDEAEKIGCGPRVQLVAVLNGPTFGLATARPCTVRVDAIGWIAGINKNFNVNLSAVAPAAIFSVACGVAKLFWASVSGMNKFQAEEYSISLSDFSLNPQLPHTFEHLEHDLGEIVMVGAGAIGSAFAYTLYHSKWKAKIHIIDRDRYNPPNIETTLLINLSDVVKNKPKAFALAEKINSPNIFATGEKSEITLAGDEIKGKPKFIISAVDNPETRRALNPKNRSTILVNGGVGGSKEDAGHILASRHGCHDPLISVLYKDNHSNTGSSTNPPDEITDECSRLAYNNVAMAAPFLGTACGALLAAICIQNNSSYTPSHHYLKLDILKQQSKMTIFGK